MNLSNYIGSNQVGLLDKLNPIHTSSYIGTHFLKLYLHIISINSSIKF